MYFMSADMLSGLLLSNGFGLETEACESFSKRQLIFLGDMRKNRVLADCMEQYERKCLESGQLSPAIYYTAGNFPGEDAGRAF